jgi:23S rRNA (adenine2503-C2)-methyltransferase
MNRINILDLAPDQAAVAVGDFMRERGEPAYRVAQILSRLWKNPIAHFGELTTLPLSLRDALNQSFELPRLELVARQTSNDGTEKFLFRLAGGQEIETVAIPEGDRMTLCISSQAGCALKCSFCATGAMGFARNLSVHEIAGQVREMHLLRPAIVPTNIVFMGMGEPLMNWGAVDPVLTILNSPDGFGIGARHITVSTVGVLPGIKALAARPEQFRLALSIHAPSDALRRELMPINIKYPLSEVVDAAAEFRRRVTFEYVMLQDVNDGLEHAIALGLMAKRCAAFVNLIPLHPGGAGDFTPTTADAIRRFAREVKKAGVEVAVRRSRGMDIAAACGQLRAERTRRRDPVGA